MTQTPNDHGVQGLLTGTAVPLLNGTLFPIRSGIVPPVPQELIQRERIQWNHFLSQQQIVELWRGSKIRLPQKRMLNRKGQTDPKPKTALPGRSRLGLQNGGSGDYGKIGESGCRRKKTSSSGRLSSTAE